MFQFSAVIAVWCRAKINYVPLKGEEMWSYMWREGGEHQAYRESLSNQSVFSPTERLNDGEKNMCYWARAELNKCDNLHKFKCFISQNDNL